MDAAAAPGGADSVGPGGDSVSDGPSPAGDPGPDERANREQASSDADVDDGGFNPLVIVAILLGIAVLAAIRPWRWIPGRS
jgi:hypothetical protein